MDLTGRHSKRHGPRGCAEDDPIEDYLDDLHDELLVRWSGDTRAIRRTLTEVHDHLLDATAQELADGHPEADARRRAVERFGPPSTVAVGRGLRPLGSAARLAGAGLGALLVAGTGLVAVGVAAAVARLLWAVYGVRFVGEVWAPGDYSAVDCSRWTAGAHTASCPDAMALDHAGDFVLMAAAAGVLGVLVLITYAVARRRWPERFVRTARARATTEWLGALAAAVTGVALLGQGTDQEIIGRTSGSGQFFSLGATALAAALFLGARRWWITGRRRRTAEV